MSARMVYYYKNDNKKQSSFFFRLNELDLGFMCQHIAGAGRKVT